METPSIILKLFVYISWFFSVLGVALGTGVRSNRRIAQLVDNIPISRWAFATCSLAIGTYLLVLSQQISGLVDYGDSMPVVDSVLRTIRLFGAMGGGSIDRDVLTLYFSPTVGWLYEFTNSLIRLAAPIDTLMGICLLVAKLFSSPRLRFQSAKRDTFIFSHLNKRSLALATGIKAHYEKDTLANETDKCLIVFADTAGMDKDSLYEQALANRMVCTDQKTSIVMRFLNGRTARRVYLFSDEDDMVNLHDGIEFTKAAAAHDEKRAKRGPIRTSEVRIISTNPASESFVDAATSEAFAPCAPDTFPHVAVRRIDWLWGTVESILWKLPLFLVEKPSNTVPSKTDPIYTRSRRRIAIVGTGNIGYEFLKAALWCSQIDGIEFTFDVIDQPKVIDTIKDRLACDAPEIMHLNGMGPSDEYHINFRGIDANGGTYLDYLHKYRDELTYLLICLGDDLTNAKVARRTREALEQGRFEAGRSSTRVDRPLICAVISDNSIAQAVQDMTTGKGVNYDIVPVGMFSDICSYENIFHPEIERMGRNINRAYWGYYDLVGEGSNENEKTDEARNLCNLADISYEKLEYNRRSSHASAIHLKYSLFSYVRRLMLASGSDASTKSCTTQAWTGNLARLDDGHASPCELSSILKRYERYVSCTSEEELSWLSVVEHNRWTAYVRTEGYELADEYAFRAFFEETGENQNRLSKQHVCLVPFDDLDQASAFVYPLTHKRSDQDYKHLDDEIVLHLKDIAEDMS